MAVIQSTGENTHHSELLHGIKCLIVVRKSLAFINLV